MRDTIKRIRSVCLMASLLIASAGIAQTAQKSALDAARVPANVTVYAATDIDHQVQCIVGARLDHNGMNERPVVYLARPGGFAWQVQLRIPKTTYQGRATHCIASAEAMFVLVQIDTQSQQELSQTLLQIVALKRETGAVMRSTVVAVPGISASYTAWVDQGREHFRLVDHQLIVTGNYMLTSDRNDPSGKDPSTFKVAVPETLSK